MINKRPLLCSETQTSRLYASQIPNICIRIAIILSCILYCDTVQRVRTCKRSSHLQIIPFMIDKTTLIFRHKQQQQTLCLPDIKYPHPCCYHINLYLILRYCSAFRIAIILSVSVLSDTIQRKILLYILKRPCNM